jgi:hypothetical protein
METNYLEENGKDGKTILKHSLPCPHTGNLPVGKPFLYKNWILDILY